MRFVTSRTAVHCLRSLSTARRMFVQKTHPVTGKVEWVDVQDTTRTLLFNALLRESMPPIDETLDRNGVVKELLSSSYYLDMLNDHHRNRTYHKALQKAIQPVQKILDIGTGSGLLAMMAADVLSQSSNSTSKESVVACESFLPMAGLAEQVMKLNSVADKIRLLNTRSDELNLDEFGRSFDLIVTEIFDSEFIGEGLLPTLRHAIRHMVKPQFKIIPCKATIFCQLVQSPVMSLWKEEGLSPGWMHPLQELDLSPLFPKDLKPLSDPVPILHFDLANPPLTNRTFNFEIPVSTDGEVDALVVWWNLKLLEDNDDLFLSTEPDWTGSHHSRQNWRQHWKQCWTGVASEVVHQGDVVNLRVHHDDLNIHLGLLYSSNRKDDVLWKQQVSTMSWRRHWELRSQERQLQYNKVFDQIIQRLKEGNPQKQQYRIVVLGEDSIFVKLVISRVENQGLVCDLVIIQESLLGFKRDSLLASNWTQKGHSSIQTLMLSDLLNHSSNLQGPGIDCVLSEPYFWSKEGREPWHHYLLFKHCVQQLKEMELVSENCIVFPEQCCLVACGATLPQLYRTRQQIQKIENWDLSILNVPLGAVPHCPSLAGSVWQFGGQFVQVTENTVLLEDDFASSEFEMSHSRSIRLEVKEQGICDCLLLWPEYKTPFTNTISTPPMSDPHFSVHGVCLLPNPTETAKSHLELSIAYNSEKACFHIEPM